MILLLEATRRALGPPLMVVAAVFYFTPLAVLICQMIAAKVVLTRQCHILYLTTEECIRLFLLSWRIYVIRFLVCTVWCNARARRRRCLLHQSRILLAWCHDVIKAAPLLLHLAYRSSVWIHLLLTWSPRVLLQSLSNEKSRILRWKSRCCRSCRLNQWSINPTNHGCCCILDGWICGISLFLKLLKRRYCLLLSLTSPWFTLFT